MKRVRKHRNKKTQKRQKHIKKTRVRKHRRRKSRQVHKFLRRILV